MPERTDISCGEAGDIQSDVTRRIALLDPRQDAEDIISIALELHTKAGWPVEVVELYIESVLSED